MDENMETRTDNRGQWFVIHTLSGHEKKVRGLLLNAINQGDEIPIYEAFIPEEKVAEVRQGTKTTHTRLIFPGYILVRMDLYDEEGLINEKAWYAIRNIQGVLGFLGGAKKPTPLSEAEVNDILRPALDEEQEVKPKITFEIGEVVRIKDGAFENFEGAVQGIDYERGKLKLSVSIFGRSTPTELEFWQVERTV